MVAARRSSITLEEPDISHWRLVGDVTADDIREIYASQTKLCANKPHIFVLVDVSKLRSVSAEARRIAAQGPTPGITVMAIRGNAIVGASFHFRIVGMLITKAAILINRGDEKPTRFFDTEANARAWFAELRQALESSSLPHN